MASRIAAVDVAGNRARLTFIERTLRRTTVTRCDEVWVDALPDEDGEEVFLRLLAALRGKVDSNDSLIVNVPPGLSTARLLSFPFGDPRKVDGAIGFELEGQVPYDVDDMVSSWVITEHHKGRTQVLCNLTQRAPVEARLAAFKAAGLEPRVMVDSGAGVAELGSGQGQRGPVAVVNLDDGASTVAVVHKGLRFVRSLRLRRGWREAEDGGAQALCRELTATLRALPAGQGAQRLIFTGDGATPGLAEAASNGVGLPGEVLDLTDALDDVSLAVEVPPGHALSLGLGLCMVRRSHPPLNVRTGTLAYHGDFDLYRGELTRIAAGVAALICITLAGSAVKLMMLKAEEENIRESFCRTTENILGTRVCDSTRALSMLRHGGGGKAGIYLPEYSAASIYEMMSRALPGEVDVAFKELDIRMDATGSDADRITGKGDAASFDTTEKMVAALKQDPCVRDTEVGRQKKARNSDRIEFSMTLHIECPAGTRPGMGLSELAMVVPEGEDGEDAAVAVDVPQELAPTPEQRRHDAGDPEEAADADEDADRASSDPGGEKVEIPDAVRERRDRRRRTLRERLKNRPMAPPGGRMRTPGLGRDLVDLPRELASPRAPLVDMDGEEGGDEAEEEDEP